MKWLLCEYSSKFRNQTPQGNLNFLKSHFHEMTPIPYYLKCRNGNMVLLSTSYHEKTPLLVLLKMQKSDPPRQHCPPVNPISWNDSFASTPQNSEIRPPNLTFYFLKSYFHEMTPTPYSLKERNGNRRAENNQNININNNYYY